ncbi:hypothetical protein PAXRUDRAFT_138365, partial [Paxillus rubicundulus Ve08.2h10]
EVLVVSDDINWSHEAFKVVVPGAESFVNGKEFLVMGVIVEFQSSEGPGVESNQVEFLVWATDREDNSDGIVGSSSLGYNRGIKYPMEVSWSILLGEAGKWNNDVGIIKNEAVVKVHETKDVLDVFNLLRFWPVTDGFDSVGRHHQAAGGKRIAEKFNGSGVEFTFFWFGAKSMFMELMEHFLGMLLVGGHILGVNEDIIQVSYNTNIKHISRNGIDKLLKHWSNQVANVLYGRQSSICLWVQSRQNDRHAGGQSLYRFCHSSESQGGQR